VLGVQRGEPVGGLVERAGQAAQVLDGGVQRVEVTVDQLGRVAGLAELFLGADARLAALVFGADARLAALVFGINARLAALVFGQSLAGRGAALPLNRAHRLLGVVGDVLDRVTDVGKIHRGYLTSGIVGSWAQVDLKSLLALSHDWMEKSGTGSPTELASTCSPTEDERSESSIGTEDERSVIAPVRYRSMSSYDPAASPSCSANWSPCRTRSPTAQDH
jgi:hypothetical protein